MAAPVGPGRGGSVPGWYLGCTRALPGADPERTRGPGRGPGVRGSAEPRGGGDGKEGCGHA